MDYEEIAKFSEQLNYRDKLRLAQLLIQLARREEEEQHPQERNPKSSMPRVEIMQYVIERLLKLKPAKKTTLLNSISAMFQFQGGISEEDRNYIISELQKNHFIVIEQNGHVYYNEKN
jgi:predicted DNA-binding ribbon-helix-helix protein